MAEERSFVSTQTFGLVVSGFVTAAIALNGFMWSNIQSLRETNLQLRGEIQHLTASTLPLDRAVTRDSAQAIEAQIEAQEVRLRASDERLRVLVVQNTKTLLVMCAQSNIEGLDCTK